VEPPEIRRPQWRTAALAFQRARPELVAAGNDGSAMAHYEGIKAFSETDQTEDLQAITVPTQTR
jgi:hypothetical protein